MSDIGVELSSPVLRPLESPAPTFEARLFLVAQSGTASFAGKLFLNATRFLTAIVLARLLGAEQYGLYNLALTAATFTASFAVLGLDVGLIRYIAIMVSRRDLNSLALVLRAGILVPLSLGTLAACSLFLAAEPLALHLFQLASLVPLLRLASLLIPVLVWNNLGESVLRGFHRLGYATLINSFAQPILRLILVWFIAFLGATAFGGLTVYLVSIVSSAVLFLFAVKPYLTLRQVRPDRHLMRELMGFSFPVYLSDIADAIGVSAQTFMLGAWGQITSVGIFAVAGQMAMTGRFLHSSLIVATMPVISEFFDRGNHDDLGRLFRTVSRWSLTLSLPLCLALFLYPSQLLNLFGASFVAGTQALQILALSTLVDTGTGIGGTLLTMTGHARLNLYNTILSTVLGVGLGVALIPLLGIVGAGLAVLGSACVINAMRLFQGYYLFRLVPYDVKFIKPLLAGGVAALLALGTEQWLPPSTQVSLLFSIVLLFGVYGLVIVVLGLSREDRMVLGRVRAGLGARRLRRANSTRRENLTEADSGAGDSREED